jgi:hypothetical protein
MKKDSFYSTLSEAVDDVLAHGFDGTERLDKWLGRLKNSIEGILAPEPILIRALKAKLSQTFKRATSPKALVKRHPGAGGFTPANVRAELRDTLDRHIAMSAKLIKLNRRAAVDEMLKRFAGWVSSVPAGGSREPDREETKKQVKRGISALPFEERRVIIDQGHKLTASIDNVIAVDGGAIAMIWHHVNQENYDARPEHVGRDGVTFLLRGSWADKQKFVKGRYYDEITAVAEEPFCRCWAEYVYALRDLPVEMLTTKGKEALLSARRMLAIA